MKNLTWRKGILFFENRNQGVFCQDVGIREGCHDLGVYSPDLDAEFFQASFFSSSVVFDAESPVTDVLEPLQDSRQVERGGILAPLAVP